MPRRDVHAQRVRAVKALAAIFAPYAFEGPRRCGRSATALDVAHVFLQPLGRELYMAVWARGITGGFAPRHCFYYQRTSISRAIVDSNGKARRKVREYEYGDRSVRRTYGQRTTVLTSSSSPTMSVFCSRDLPADTGRSPSRSVMAVASCSDIRVSHRPRSEAVCTPICLSACLTVRAYEAEFRGRSFKQTRMTEDVRSPRNTVLRAQFCNAHRCRRSTSQEVSPSIFARNALDVACIFLIVETRSRDSSTLCRCLWASMFSQVDDQALRHTATNLRWILGGIEAHLTSRHKPQDNYQDLNFLAPAGPCGTQTRARLSKMSQLENCRWRGVMSEEAWCRIMACAESGERDAE